MKISVLNTSEIRAIKPLWELLNKTHYEKSNNWKNYFADLTFEKRIEAILSSDNFSVFVSKMTGELEGYCIVSINNGVGEIDSIFVKEKYRKSLIGQNLLKYAIEWLENHNAESIIVGVAEGNEWVLPFYEKLGFKKNMTILKKV